MCLLVLIFNALVAEKRSADTETFSCFIRNFPKEQPRKLLFHSAICVVRSCILLLCSIRNRADFEKVSAEVAKANLVYFIASKTRFSSTKKPEKRSTV